MDGLGAAGLRHHSKDTLVVEAREGLPLRIVFVGAIVAQVVGHLGRLGLGGRLRHGHRLGGPSMPRTARWAAARSAWKAVAPSVRAVNLGFLSSIAASAAVGSTGAALAGAAEGSPVAGAARSVMSWSPGWLKAPLTRPTRRRECPGSGSGRTGTRDAAARWRARRILTCAAHVSRVHPTRRRPSRMVSCDHSAAWSSGARMATMALPTWLASSMASGSAPSANSFRALSKNGCRDRHSCPPVQCGGVDAGTGRHGMEHDRERGIAVSVV